MAEAKTRPIRLTKSGIVLQDVPYSASEEEIRAAAERAAAASQTIPTSEIMWEQVAQPEDTRTREEILGVAPTEQPTEEETPQGQTTLKGILDSVIRGAGDEAAAASLGALIGSAIPGVGTIAGAGAGLLAKSGTEAVLGLVDLGRNIVSNLTGFEGDIEGMSPEQMWATIFDAAGFERPDTAVEQMFHEAGRGVGDTATMLSGGRAIAARGTGPGGLPIANPSVPQRAAQITTQAPGEQMIGGFTGGFGEEAVAEGARRRNLTGPWAQAAARLGGGIAGDILGSGVLSTPGVHDVNRAARRMEGAGITPTRARNAIQAGREMDVPVYRSDIFPPDTPTAKLRRDMREGIRWGMGTPRVRQEQARLNAVRNELAEFDVHIGDPSVTLTDDMVSEFVGPRQTALNTYVGQKHGALAEIPPDAVVDTSNTINYIDEQIETLTRRGALNTDVNVDQAVTNATAQDLAQNNVYAPTIQKLKRWRAAFQNKGVEDIENLRSQFRQDFSMDRPQGAGFKTEEDRIIDSVYSNLRRDLGESVRQHGGEDAYRAWDEANIHLQNLSRDFNDEALKRLVRRVDESVPIDEALNEKMLADEATGGETMAVSSQPELLRRLVISEDPSLVETVMGRMSPKGQNLAAAAFLEDVVSKSVRNIRDLSPDDFANVVHDEMARRGVILNRDQNERLQALEEILDVTRRASVVAGTPPANPTQAVNTVPGARYALARSIVKHPVFAAIAGVGSLGLGSTLARIYESPAVRDQLLELVSGEADPQKMQRLTLSVLRTVAREYPDLFPEEEEEGTGGVSAEGRAPTEGVSAERRAPQTNREVPATLRGRE